MIKSLVSIIIPTFNRADLIGETLDSVLAQTYTNWECIIVDDGSTDNTFEVIQKYVNADSRFKYFSRPADRPKGGNACRNFGFEMSEGEFVNWFDSDDIMLPLFLKEKFHLLENSNFDAIVGYGAYFNMNSNEVFIAKPKMDSEVVLLDFVKNEMFLSLPGPLWKKSFLKGKDLFDEHRQKIQDVEFHFRMLLADAKIAFYKEAHLFLIRRGEDRVSSQSNLNIRKQIEIFNYNYDTFCHSLPVDQQYRIEYSQFTAKKVFQSYYQLMLAEKSLRKRLILLKRVKYKFYHVLKNVEENSLTKSNYTIGLVLMTVFQKGFKIYQHKL